MDADNETRIEISCDSSEPDHKISPNDVSSVEDDASVEDTEDKQKEDEHSTIFPC
ncbi:uncharacterized protein G2W53_040905 [Senna tora]|uniref:Uncharacterized protein n=1 Tax=Senna tora TaxID=362788 RepID=A0A834SR18_9FABA|nr:uncharacterized protein G2W53_040905 [Senna tora]